ncbi:NAD-dependent epimerase [Mesorhizobium sp. B3-2-1]|uniref:NAD-dependent epimerase n=1 Tax=unclassified Mesorhizobium TaxID=325217 RepID=UPI00112E58CF|nr:MULTISPECIES: NAD-dependent epimerase [unclassified Mesorhizobium]MBZ9673821.1 NAD-dependent epimerase [Mesorhizobium sp. ES1-3]MBZ9711086.1 NAD-dependent epimerase [Mesorhizobium sp. ESP7-2]TPI22381.1 NAD-dependent epimerase [Mesorhizobium sp. B3-2-1]
MIEPNSAGQEAAENLPDVASLSAIEGFARARSDQALLGLARAGPIVVTGAAGFIGFHAARRLLHHGVNVIGVDNFNPYYDPRLKEARFELLSAEPGFSAVRIDLSDRGRVESLFSDFRPSHVVHLAAQAGVRHSLVDPHAYVQSNVVAFLNVLEGCRHAGIEHLVYASSSSVYGANRTIPFSEHHGANHPLSLYAATKRSNECMAHSYSHLFGLPVTGLRFFTVYGPWGRPDMAVYAFTHAIAQGRTIDVANAGRAWRDFTYIDDIVEGVIRVLAAPPSPNLNWDSCEPDAATSSAPYRVYNIGNDRPEEINRLIAIIEAALGRRALRVDVPLPAGDVLETRADVSDLRRAVGFAPSTTLVDGVSHFVKWYREFHETCAA